MSDTTLIQQLVDLFQEAGQAHHQAYIETDGAHDEWPLWYADYLQEPLGRLLNQPFTQSEIVYHIVRLDKAYTRKARMQSWSEFYARELVGEFGG